ncbi:Vng6368h (plasmid) [Halobacterium salinarum NRC-1]|uniref:Spurious ORF n=1 Tax=Halobacterium salinarum (strain ATCC 700922 / JCM 11081 / NRC-1) TaxID=64091 RepID=Q9HHJ2_HALSA|nr:Vng6368h [Halobacterium salinarum NRC-1]DAC79954.1 TPA_inf: spurious ORF [Halobacterium salinarum NRC-1]
MDPTMPRFPCSRASMMERSRKLSSSTTYSRKRSTASRPTPATTQPSTSSIAWKKTPASTSTHSPPTPSRQGRPSSANRNRSPSSTPALSRICKPRGSAIYMRLTTILTLSRMSIDSIQQRIPMTQTDAGWHHGWRRRSVSG